MSRRGKEGAMTGRIRGRAPGLVRWAKPFPLGRQPVVRLGWLVGEGEGTLGLRGDPGLRSGAGQATQRRRKAGHRPSAGT